MNIKCIKKNKKYVRNIEGMGEGLVLFKIVADERRIGQNYHLFYEDKCKPPLDIAINPDNGTIEYISYFIKDEKIQSEVINREIDYQKGIIIIEDERFDEKNVNIIYERKFNIIKNNNDIFILSDFVNGKKLQAYQIDALNYLLFYHNEFCGMILRDIINKEWNEILNSQCIQKRI